VADLTTSKQVSRVKTYQVTPGHDVTIDLIVGMGRPSGSSVRLDGVALAHGPDVRGLVVGEGHALVGKHLVVTAIVVDNVANGRASATLQLVGGTGPVSILADETPDPGQPVEFAFRVTFA
jgi:hypothetical protein